MLRRGVRAKCKKVRTTNKQTTLFRSNAEATAVLEIFWKSGGGGFRTAAKKSQINQPTTNQLLVKNFICKNKQTKKERKKKQKKTTKKEGGVGAWALALRQQAEATSGRAST